MPLFTSWWITGFNTVLMQTESISSGKKYKKRERERERVEDGLDVCITDARQSMI